MGRFFNKNELVIIVIIILFFDLNNFTESITNQIINKEKLNIILFLLLIILISFDLYIFYSVTYSIPTAPKYYNVQISNPKDSASSIEQNLCQEEVNHEINNYTRDIEEISKIDCNNYQIEKNYIRVKRIVMVIVSIVLFMIVLSGMATPGSNPFYIRALLSLLITLLIFLILYYAYSD